MIRTETQSRTALESCSRTWEGHSFGLETAERRDFHRIGRCPEERERFLIGRTNQTRGPLAFLLDVIQPREQVSFKGDFLVVFGLLDLIVSFLSLY